MWLFQYEWIWPDHLHHAQCNLESVVNAVGAITSGVEIDVCLLNQYELKMRSSQTYKCSCLNHVLILPWRSVIPCRIHRRFPLMRGRMSDYHAWLLDTVLETILCLNTEQEAAIWCRETGIPQAGPQGEGGGIAKHVVEGLSNSGTNYPEAIDCLQKRYDRPRLIYQAHVCAMLNAPTLKDRNGKEIRQLFAPSSRFVQIWDYATRHH